MNENFLDSSFESLVKCTYSDERRTVLKRSLTYERVEVRKNWAAKPQACVPSLAESEGPLGWVAASSIFLVLLNAI